MPDRHQRKKRDTSYGAGVVEQEGEYEPSQRGQTNHNRGETSESSTQPDSPDGEWPPEAPDGSGSDSKSRVLHTHPSSTAEEASTVDSSARNNHSNYSVQPQVSVAGGIVGVRGYGAPQRHGYTSASTPRGSAPSVGYQQLGNTTGSATANNGQEQSEYWTWSAEYQNYYHIGNVQGKLETIWAQR